MLNKIVSNISVIDNQIVIFVNPIHTLYISKGQVHTFDVINIFVMKKRRKEEDAFNIRDIYGLKPEHSHSHSLTSTYKYVWFGL